MAAHPQARRPSRRRLGRGGSPGQRQDRAHQRRGQGRPRRLLDQRGADRRGRDRPVGRGARDRAAGVHRADAGDARRPALRRRGLAVRDQVGRLPGPGDPPRGQGPDLHPQRPRRRDLLSAADPAAGGLAGRRGGDPRRGGRGSRRGRAARLLAPPGADLAIDRRTSAGDCTVGAVGRRRAARPRRLRPTRRRPRRRWSTRSSTCSGTTADRCSGSRSRSASGCSGRSSPTGRRSASPPMSSARARRSIEPLRPRASRGSWPSTGARATSRVGGRRPGSSSSCGPSRRSWSAAGRRGRGTPGSSGRSSSGSWRTASCGSPGRSARGSTHGLDASSGSGSTRWPPKIRRSRRHRVPGPTCAASTGSSRGWSSAPSSAAGAGTGSSASRPTRGSTTAAIPRRSSGNRRSRAPWPRRRPSARSTKRQAEERGGQGEEGRWRGA